MVTKAETGRGQAKQKVIRGMFFSYYMHGMEQCDEPPNVGEVSVGSRDGAPSHKRSIHWTLWHPYARKPASTAVLTRMPVSYTHLTLPTILLV